ncbi:MAG: hypothetical protein Q8K99_06045 [Actinomycetota bacterium]|nr:hypothetical protein [Actinomycetota bacterium]
MHIQTHERLTRQWALEAGFSRHEADELALWNGRVDRAFPGRKLRYKRFHLVLWGAGRLAEEYLRVAVDERSLAHLGVALHCAQDAIGHGIVGSVIHWPGLDAWERRSERIRTRIEAESKRLMRLYRAPEPRKSRAVRDRAYTSTELLLPHSGEGEA